MTSLSHRRMNVIQRVGWKVVALLALLLVSVVEAKPKLIFGIFNQNIFTIAGDDARPDVNVSIIQPIVNRGNDQMPSAVRSQ